MGKLALHPVKLLHFHIKVYLWLDLFVAKCLYALLMLLSNAVPKAKMNKHDYIAIYVSGEHERPKSAAALNNEVVLPS